MRELVSRNILARALTTLFLSISLLLVSPGIYDSVNAWAANLPASADAATTSSTTASNASDTASSSSTTSDATGSADTARIAAGTVVTVDQTVPGVKATPVKTAVTAVADTTKTIAATTVDSVKSDISNIVTGKEMSKLEKILWSVGKAVVPTIAVIAFAATCACPITWLVVGSIAIGALAGGGMSLLADWRANHFKDEAGKKSSVDMLRDASIAAVTNAVAAPFTLVGGSLVAQAGKFTVMSVMKSAALQGATSFVSGVASKAAGGMTLNIWDKAYYKKGEQAAAKQAELDTLIAKYENSTGDIPAADLEKMAALQDEIDTLKKGTYDAEDFTNDVSTSAIDGVIGGFLGGVATNVAATTTVAKRASMALFKNTSNAGSVAQLVVSNPFNFASGATKAQYSKVTINSEISSLQKERDALPADSAARQYYDAKIANLEQQRDSIDVVKAGTDQMVNSLITNSVGLGVSVAKTRLYDIPKAKRAAVDKDYQAQNDDWVSANTAKAAYNAKKAAAPKRADFDTDADFQAAVTQHKQDLASLKTTWQSAQKTAQASDKTPENQAIRQEISKRYDTNKAIDQRLEIARIYGEESYKKARMELIKESGKIESWKDGRQVFVIREQGRIKKRIELDPNDPQGSLDTKLDALVTESIKVEYGQKVVSSQKSIDEMEAKLKAYDDIKKNGTLETNSDGSRHLVVRDADGNVTKDITIDPKYKNWENDPQVKTIEAAALKVKPSSYKAAVVQKQIAEMKASGATDAQVKAATEGFVKSADTAMVDTFGGSMWNCVKQEAVAGQLSKVEFDGEGASALAGKIKKILAQQPDKIRKGLVNEYVKEVNAEINEQLTSNVNTGNDYGDKALKTLIEKSVTTTTGIISDETQDAVGNSLDKVLENL